MSEKFRLDRKIGFQNTFYTKSINVTIDSIGPSIILRSLIHMGRRWNCLLYIDDQTFCIDIHILFNSMGSWYMNLSDYMGGQCLWKFNSMGGWVKNKVPSSPSRYFFWNSPKSVTK